jgi:microcystin-dependent protein
MDIISKTTGDKLQAVEFMQIPDELESFISSSGQTPSSSVLDQTAKAVAIYTAVSDFYTDGGSINAYVLAPQTGFKAPIAYKNGMKVRFRPANANTGASTINIAGIGVKDIKLEDGSTDIGAGFILSTQDISLRFDEANDCFVPVINNNGIPAGLVMAFASSTAPNGYLECNGSAISRATYSVLFSIIGTTYGAGDGSTTFNIPDLRAEFIRGWDNSRGIDTGRVFGSAQSDELKSHSHAFRITEMGGDSTLGSRVDQSGGGAVTSIDFATDSTGDSETRPRNIAMLYCIKY